MAPGKAHEDAVAIVKSILKDEFEVDESAFRDLTLYRLRPDILLKNPITERYIVVEVGNTDAEKIGVYLGVKKIEQIRWYTKYSKRNGVNLSGIWFTDDLSRTHISPKSCRVREKERYLKSEIEDYTRQLENLKVSLDSYVCCSGCGCHMLLRQASFITHYNRRYCVCMECQKLGYFTTMSSQREELYNYINAKRQFYYERQAANG